MSAFSYAPPVGESINLGTVRDVDLSTPPTDGQALVFDDGDSKWKAADVGGGGLPPGSASQILIHDGAAYVSRFMFGDATISVSGAVSVTDDSHRHTVLYNGNNQDVAIGQVNGLLVADGSGDDPVITFANSTLGILGLIELDGTNQRMTCFPTIGGTTLVVEDNGDDAELRLTSTGNGSHRMRLQNSEGQARMVADGDSVFLQVNTSPTSESGWTTVFARGPIAPVVTGSRGGNAALASLLTALDQLFLIDDQTTA